MDEVICVILEEVLHVEVVGTKGGGCFAGAIFPEAWGVLHQVISEG